MKQVCRYYSIPCESMWISMGLFCHRSNRHEFYIRLFTGVSIKSLEDRICISLSAFHVNVPILLVMCLTLYDEICFSWLNVTRRLITEIGDQNSTFKPQISIVIFMWNIFGYKHIRTTHLDTNFYLVYGKIST
jgi:hypothetical protein